MRDGQIKNIPVLKDRRRELRRNKTKAEALLWSVLKNSQLRGKKFRRQQSFGGYIVDFYCPSEKLIVELDGEIHDNPEQVDYDLERENYLKNLNNKVLRFRNEIVFQELESVLSVIASNFRK